MKSPLKSRSVLTGGLVLAVISAILSPVGPTHADDGQISEHGTDRNTHLNLGAADLPENRTVTTLAPGVTLTKISRGGADSSLFWTAEVAIPSDSPDPDAPASALSSQATAQRTADKLKAAGVDARIEQVQSPQLADAGGDLGYRVRAGHLAARDDGASVVAKIKAAGFASSVIYSGWDGDAGTSTTTRGPWNLDVITIDPGTYQGQLAASFGPDLEKRETTSQLASDAHAIAAINAGFFVFDPKAGAEGDPAGVGVYAGKTLSEPVADRPGLVIDGKKNATSIQRLTWAGKLSSGSGETALDGIDRVPGLIRNCGGANDLPTPRALQDVTCTNPNELVTFTPEFGPSTPAGAGLEVTVDSHDTVTSTAETRGTAVPVGGHTVQATGTDVARLRALAPVGAKLKIDAGLLGPDGKTLHTNRSTSVVNGGPLLVKDGSEDVTVKHDGMVHPNDGNSFYYGWVHKRNPRTFAGTDAQGRTILVTADGRSTASLGLSLKEEADVAVSLGMVQAMNLDGGGSTTAVASGKVLNSPSGGSERAVGDALLVLPARKDEQ
ncbi:phosphodiester glycosidase family protein [Arthrobacter sp. MI7-26]|uniref:phosphodiester glycosidase family protein n=1 Tax=Arthrobacter sp. MI7-26 TaxID=2993653 RepID=UPI0022491A7B|nr:phosphodiester glycosidase family protein [Arthrobacter sp. MI7-26]MCX2748847.1 phosphodiester glycosidase family protein [Arthrobacter sp. MI7-26]